MTRALLAFAALALMWLAPATSAQALNCLPFVGCSCNVVASDITFDDFSPLNAGAQTAIGEIDVTCGGVLGLGGGVTIEVLQGQWGTYAARKMRSAAGDTIDYNIYTTGAYGQVWGAGGQAVVVNAGVILLNNWSASRDMFARVIPAPTMKPGDYTDTVVVRVIW